MICSHLLPIPLSFQMLLEIVCQYHHHPLELNLQLPKQAKKHLMIFRRLSGPDLQAAEAREEDAIGHHVESAGAFKF